MTRLNSLKYERLKLLAYWHVLRTARSIASCHEQRHSIGKLSRKNRKSESNGSCPLPTQPCFLCKNIVSRSTTAMFLASRDICRLNPYFLVFYFSTWRLTWDSNWIYLPQRKIGFVGETQVEAGSLEMDGTFERMKPLRSLVSEIKFATRLRRPSSWRRRRARGRVRIVTRDVPPVHLQVVSTHWILFIEHPSCASFNYAFSQPRTLYTEGETRDFRSTSPFPYNALFGTYCTRRRSRICRATYRKLSIISRVLYNNR